MKAAHIILSVAVFLGVSGGCSHEPADIATFPDAVRQATQTATSAEMAIGPIPGFTRGWHELRDRARLTLPQGVDIQLRMSIPPGGDLVFEGGLETRRDKEYAYASCPTAQTGEMAIAGLRVESDGTLRRTECKFRVIPMSPQTLTGGNLRISPVRPELAEDMSNTETVDAYFGQSIAGVVQVAPDHYRTAAGTTLRLSLEGLAPAMADIAEWMIDGAPVALGQATEQVLETMGRHTISIGAPGASRDITIDAYDVTIAREGAASRIPVGELVTFTAKTNPPGFEGEVTWLAATKYGRAEPTLGKGARFTTVFTATMLEGYQWLGVRADDQTLGQDVSLNDFVVFDPSDEPTQWIEPAPGENLTLAVFTGGGMSSSPHSIAWSTDHPSVSVAPSNSIVHFDASGSLVLLEFNPQVVSGNEHTFNLVGIVTGPEFSGLVQQFIRIIKQQAVSGCPLIVTEETHIPGQPTTTTTKRVQGPMFKPPLNRGFWGRSTQIVGNQLVTTTSAHFHGTGQATIHRYVCDAAYACGPPATTCQGIPAGFLLNCLCQ